MITMYGNYTVSRNVKVVKCIKLTMVYLYTVQITFIFIDFRVCDFAFAFKTQNAPCVSRFKRVLFSDRDVRLTCHRV